MAIKNIVSTYIWWSERYVSKLVNVLLMISFFIPGVGINKKEGCACTSGYPGQPVFGVIRQGVGTANISGGLVTIGVVLEAHTRCRSHRMLVDAVVEKTAMIFGMLKFRFPYPWISVS